MAELLEASDIMFTPFEPKLQHRFVMLVDGIPSYLIKTSAKPQITFDEVELNHINTKHWVKGKGAWDQLEITLYDAMWYPDDCESDTQDILGGVCPSCI